MQQAGKQPSQPKNFIGMNGQQTGLGFANRDTEAKRQQEKNIITFKIIKNDQSRESMKFLLDLKNIFARQLPKMPKEYIVKLVFDRNHESMILLKDGVKVIGGICFRPFVEAQFVQIAFLAITSTEQIRGYGTRLMNKLKEQMQKRKVKFMMTYADNLALGYFRKQGFSKDIRTEQQKWKGYIKDYEGGTLMECLIHPSIDYSRVSEIIKKQKEFVVSKLKELSINNVKYEGKVLERLAEKQKQFKHTTVDGQVQYFRFNPEKIPGIVQGGWTWQDHDQLMKTKELSFQLQCSSILDLLKKYSSSWPFREPVSLDDVPDYNSIVKRPIDLKTIEKKLVNSQYNTRAEFCEDILRIFSNCRLYNQPETVYHKCSLECEEYIKPHLEKMKDETQDFLSEGIRMGDKAPKKHHAIKKRVQKRK